jgi:hypothetical protein
MSMLLMPFILLVFFFFGVSGFAIWAFLERGKIQRPQRPASSHRCSEGYGRYPSNRRPKYAEEAKKPS